MKATLAWMFSLALATVGSGCAADAGSEDSSSSESTALTTPSFTYSPAAPEHVGSPVSFDGSATICGTSSCTYQWSWYFPRSGGGFQVGGQMGSGPAITYTFDSFAASKPYVLVQLKVIENNSTHNFRTASTSFSVAP